MWIPIVGDESLTCEQEEHNESKTDVANMWVDCVSKMIVGHVALDWTKVASKFLQITNHPIRVEVTGKRVNRGVEWGLKPVNFF